MPIAPRPLVLVILDGFGLRAERTDNAVALARAPRYHDLLARYPHTEIGASGPDVGLPPGQMGNSEVGHLNFGAGRIAQMDIARIDCAVSDGTLAENEQITSAIELAKHGRGRLHLLGLVSDGGVHSSLTHLFALIDLAAASGVEVVVHAFLDGRDTPPRSAEIYLTKLEQRLAGKGRIGTVMGRYWAMDRDKRWDRVRRAYDAIVRGVGSKSERALTALRASYEAGKDDEFVEPVVLSRYAGVALGKDTAIFFNFRADRAREITQALTDPKLDDFPRPSGAAATPFVTYVCMTTYDRTFPLPIAFPQISYPDIFPEILARHEKTQFRCAETEKFAHVTFFFNGGREEPWPGEERLLVPSRRDVATYDLAPAMSANEITAAVVSAIESDKFDFILVNFANPDMVGHTGFLDATVTAVEVVDAGVGAIVDAALAKKGAVLVTADHGNCEQMKDLVTGAPHTAHTTNPVPFLLVDDARKGQTLVPHGRICDVAPTMLEMLGIDKPEAMTGVSLFARP